MVTFCWRLCWQIAVTAEVATGGQLATRSDHSLPACVPRRAAMGVFACSWPCSWLCPVFRADSSIFPTLHNHLLLTLCRISFAQGIAFGYRAKKKRKFLQDVAGAELGMLVFT